MKNITKLILIPLMLVIFSVAHAQIYGIRAGLNLSNVHLKYDNTVLSEDFKMNPGFLLGPTADFLLSDYLSIETGILLSTKGFKTSEKESYQNETMEYKSKLNLLYIDIPVALKGRISLSDNIDLFVSAGPNIGFGVSGKSKSEFIYNGETETSEENVEWGTDPKKSMLKRPEFGLVMGIGIEYEAYQFGIFYNIGLTNIAATSADDATKLKNRVLNISANYRFVRK